METYMKGDGHSICKCNDIVYKKYEKSLFLYSKEELHNHINNLNFLSDIFGCVIHCGHEDNNSAFVIFAGNLERYALLTVARGLKCKVIYLQDTVSWWYNGSYILPEITRIIDFIRSETKNMKCTFFGQSSGGYAALVAAGLIVNSDVIACSPQTFSDFIIKSEIYFSKQLSVNVTPSYLIDIKELYKDVTRTGISAIIVPGCEYSNPYQNHFWVDHLHAFRLSELRNINIFVSSVSRHSVIFRNSSIISALISDFINLDHADLERKKALIETAIDQIKGD